MFLEVPKKIKRSLSKKEQGFNLIENEMRNVIGNKININDLVNLKEFPSVNTDYGIKFMQNSNFSANSLDKTIQVFKDEGLI